MSPKQLAPVFTLADARDAGLRKHQVYAMIANGEIERVGRGVYLYSESIDPAFVPLAAASAVQPMATMCLTSALVHHGLSDAIPFESDIAVPRGTRFPAGINHVAWHTFDPRTFIVGREIVPIAEGATAATFSAERTIVDIYRLMHIEGVDVAHEALRRWLRRPGSSPSELLHVAASFPKVEPGLRQALEVLL